MIAALASRLRGSGADNALNSFEVRFAKLWLRIFPNNRFRIYKMLARLLDAEIDARTALEFIYDVVSNDGRKKGEPDAVAVAHWLRAYQEHGQLSDALVGWVPQTEVLLLEAGERSGRFQHALGVMLRLNEKMGAIRGQIMGKLAYPLALSLMLAAVLYYLSTTFMPTIVAMKINGQWTGTGATIVALLTWVKSGLIPLLLAIAALIVAVFLTLPIFRGRARIIFDWLPPWSIHRFTSGTGFLTALLVLMESGRGLLDAITLVRPSASPYLAEKVARIEGAIREGHDFGRALAASGDQFPDSVLIKEIQIFSHIGRLDEGLLSVVEQWMDTATTRALAQISMLGMGLMFSTFAVLGFVMTGLYDMIGQLKQGY
jgi:type II secretory pathway component PulF